MKTKLFLFAAFVMLSTSGLVANNVNNVIAKKSNENGQSYCGVTAQQISSYMAGFGITITSIIPMDGTCDVKCKATNGHTYIVHISDGIIKGYDDTGF